MRVCKCHFQINSGPKSFEHYQNFEDIGQKVQMVKKFNLLMKVIFDSVTKDVLETLNEKISEMCVGVCAFNCFTVCTFKCFFPNSFLQVCTLEAVEAV